MDQLIVGNKCYPFECISYFYRISREKKGKKNNNITKIAKIAQQPIRWYRCDTTLLYNSKENIGNINKTLIL